MKAKKAKPVNAWGYGWTCATGDDLLGPVFYTRAEARTYKRESKDIDAPFWRIARVEVKEV